MSDPYGNPLPPRHGEDEAWTDEQVPVCPDCGRGIRRHSSFGAHYWRCDIHGPIIPRWVEPEKEET